MQPMEKPGTFPPGFPHFMPTYHQPTSLVSLSFWAPRAPCSRAQCKRITFGMLGNSHSFTACSINSRAEVSSSRTCPGGCRIYSVTGGNSPANVQGQNLNLGSLLEGPTRRNWGSGGRLTLAQALKDVQWCTEPAGGEILRIQSIPEKVSQMFFQICLNLIDLT